MQNKYYYDDIGQLIREDNNALGKTYVYTYDYAGNRTSKKTYAYTTSTTLGTAQSTETYSYADNPEYEYWGDQLQSINGYDITYDNVGNPLEYYLDYIDEFRLFDLEWEGRNLVYLSENSAGELDIYYAYNDEGIRISKTVADTEYKYTLNGSQIVAQEWDNKLIIFFYDESGSPIGYAYRTTSMAADTFYYYIYEKNLQGDIVAIYNTSGVKLVSYTYDAWGNVTTTNHNISGTNVGAQYNPFRYRGYYYDEEAGLYYLNSRYYDPSTGRFLNADIILPGASGDLNGYNLYSYCFNDPINLFDSNGQWPKSAKDVWGFVENELKCAIRFAGVMIESFINNVNIEAGVGVGMGGEVEVGSVGVEAVVRMDFVGRQFKDGKMRTGHIGRSAIAVSGAGQTIGPQNDTFETFDGERDPTEDTYWYSGTIGFSTSAYFVIGYHASISFDWANFLDDVLAASEKYYQGD